MSEKQAKESPPSVLRKNAHGALDAYYALVASVSPPAPPLVGQLSEAAFMALFPGPLKKVQPKSL